MDNEMIDRCAKAAALADGYDSWDTAHKLTIKKYTDEAIAVIKALREPTEKMKKDFDLAAPMYDDPNTTGEEYWQVGIDSILND